MAASVCPRLCMAFTPVTDDGAVGVLPGAGPAHACGLPPGLRDAAAVPPGVRALLERADPGRPQLPLPPSRFWANPEQRSVMQRVRAAYTTMHATLQRPDSLMASMYDGNTCMLQQMAFALSLSYTPAEQWDRWRGHIAADLGVPEERATANMMGASGRSGGKTNLTAFAIAAAMKEVPEERTLPHQPWGVVFSASMKQAVDVIAAVVSHLDDMMDDDEDLDTSRVDRITLTNRHGTRVQLWAASPCDGARGIQPTAVAVADEFIFLGGPEQILPSIRHKERVVLGITTPSDESRKMYGMYRECLFGDPRETDVTGVDAGRACPECSDEGEAIRCPHRRQNVPTWLVDDFLDVYTGSKAGMLGIDPATVFRELLGVDSGASEAAVPRMFLRAWSAQRTVPLHEVLTREWRLVGPRVFVMVDPSASGDSRTAILGALQRRHVSGGEVQTILISGENVRTARTCTAHHVDLLLQALQAMSERAPGCSHPDTGIVLCVENNAGGPMVNDMVRAAMESDPRVFQPDVPRMPTAPHMQNMGFTTTQAIKNAGLELFLDAATQGTLLFADPLVTTGLDSVGPDGPVYRRRAGPGDDPLRQVLIGQARACRRLAKGTLSGKGVDNGVDKNDDLFIALLLLLHRIRQATQAVEMNQ
jgi:hypothetical protein